jgi:hypothetical protein
MTDPRGAEAGGLAGLNLTGLMQTGGLPFGPKSKGGTLGTILAPGMPDYPESAAAKAAEELAQGASVRDIWSKHKLYPWKDADGNQALLGEIPDYKAKLNLPVLKSEAPSDLDALLVHPEFFKNNPNLAKLRIEKASDPTSHELGYTVQNNANPRIVLNTSHVAHSDKASVLRTLLHELTHVQQRNNNLPTGTSPETMRAVLNMQKYKEGMAGKPEGYQPRFGEFNTTTPEEAFTAYQKAAGEAQARMTEARFRGPRALDKVSPISTLDSIGNPVENLLWNYMSGTKQDMIKVPAKVVKLINKHKKK